MLDAMGKKQVTEGNMGSLTNVLRVNQGNWSYQIVYILMREA